MHREPSGKAMQQRCRVIVVATVASASANHGRCTKAAKLIERCIHTQSISGQSREATEAVTAVEFYYSVIYLIAIRQLEAP